MDVLDVLVKGIDLAWNILTRCLVYGIRTTLVVLLFLITFLLEFSHIAIFSLAIGSGRGLAKAEMQGCELVFPPLLA